MTDEVEPVKPRKRVVKAPEPEPVQTLESRLTQFESCVQCQLCKTRTHTAPMKGSFDAKVIFVGEAPGKMEDAWGVPFVGPSGHLLQKWIERLGLKYGDYAVINSVFCRPSDDRDQDRRPTQEELNACAPNFKKLLTYFTNPNVKIVALGNSAKQRLSELGIPFMFIYHPSYYLRHGGHGWEEALNEIAKSLE